MIFSCWSTNPHARGPERNGADARSYMIVASSGPRCPSIISSATPGEGVTVTR